MTINYNVTGADRKRLVSTISEITNSPVSYKGAPTFAYEVDLFTIDKNGCVSFDDLTDSEKIETLIDGLFDKGFEAEEPERADALVIEYPRADVSDAALENLRLLVAGKETLIKKALNADVLPIEISDDKISFPWFKGWPDPAEVSAYAHFTGKLIGMAKTQRRVTAKDKQTDNEKYAFRCFLLRLGFIGSEYKEERKILLRNLSGSSAFKGGKAKPRKKGFSQDDLDKAKADPAIRAEINTILNGEDGGNDE